MENNFENIAPETAAPAANFVDKAKAGVTGVISKVKADPKGFGVKLGAIVLAAIIVIVGLFVGVGAATNNYKTPLKLMANYQSMKKYDADASIKLFNGFCEKELKDFFKLMKSSEEWEDSQEDAKESFDEQVEELKDEYGNNFKYKYKVVEKERFEKGDLDDAEDALDTIGTSLKAYAKQLKDATSEELESFADSLGFDGNRTKAKKFIEIMEDIAKEYKGAKVTDGYTLTVEVSVGDEVLEDDKEIVVIKVNGRWVNAETVCDLELF